MLFNLIAPSHKQPSLCWFYLCRLLWHYKRTSIKIKSTTTSKPVRLWNGVHTKASSIGFLLNLLALSEICKTSQTWKDNVITALMSMGKLCDDGCAEVAVKHNCIKCHLQKPITKVLRCSTATMHVLDLKNLSNLCNNESNQNTKEINIKNFTSLNKGYNWIFITYAHDDNVTLVRLLKPRNACSCLDQRGNKPKWKVQTMTHLNERFLAWWECFIPKCATKFT